MTDRISVNTQKHIIRLSPDKFTPILYTKIDSTPAFHFGK